MRLTLAAQLQQLAQNHIAAMRLATPLVEYLHWAPIRLAPPPPATNTPMLVTQMVLQRHLVLHHMREQQLVTAQEVYLLWDIAIRLVVLQPATNIHMLLTPTALPPARVLRQYMALPQETQREVYLR